MVLLYNKTKCTQILDIKGYAVPAAICPGMIFDPTPYVILIDKFFEEFDNTKLVGAKHVVTLRQYALGDLIQLVPVLRKLKTDRDVKSVGVLTSERFRADMSKAYPDIQFYAMDMAEHTKADFVLNLDGLLEKDHSLQNQENSLHRVKIYADYFGVSVDNLDWSSNLPETNKIKKSKMKKIGLQIRGSGPIKTLPFDFIKQIAFELSKDYEVVLLDNDKSFGFEGKNIINLCGQIKVPECIAILTLIDCVITMDSGMLWMAHSAKCPVVTFLGSTREQERMSLHPLYPDKARTINMAKLVGCEPCFETRVRCKGKHNCMTAFNRDEVLGILKSEVKSIVGE